MFVKMVMTRRSGRALRKGELEELRPLYGELSIAETNYRNVGRVRHLDLIDPNNTTAAGHLATLLYPELENLGSRILVFRGFEVIQDGAEKRSYMQQWRCTVLTDLERVNAPSSVKRGR